MTVELIDFSYARPTVAQILNAGYRHVIRYLSHDPAKTITRAEYELYLSAGISVTLVWEQAAGAALLGASQGLTDGLAAAFEAHAIGYPATAAIYYAVDRPVDVVQLRAVLDYLAAADAADGAPYRAGVYGPFDVVETAAVHGVPYCWQTMAWSGGLVSRHAQLLQTLKPSVLRDVDVDDVVNGATDWGQAPRYTTTPPNQQPPKTTPPKTTPPAPPAPTESEPDMILYVDPSEAPKVATDPPAPAYELTVALNAGIATKVFRHVSLAEVDAIREGGGRVTFAAPPSTDPIWSGTGIRI